jgi:hypothetical protein
MDARILTELPRANDNDKPKHADKSGGIAVDVLPTGGVLLRTLEIRILEQMPQRRNPAHSHFIPLLPSPPKRPRNLPQQPHPMKPSRCITSELDRAKMRDAKALNWEEAKFWRSTSSELDRSAAKNAKARENELAKACGSKMQPRRTR